jgi:hypothetical protein
VANGKQKLKNLKAPKQRDWKSLVPLVTAIIYLLVELMKKL